MLDIKFIRENKELVKENIRNKFQDEKLPLVDEVIDLDIKIRELKQKGDTLRQDRNTISNEIGILVKEKNLEKVEENKKKVSEINKTLIDIEKDEEELSKKLRDNMLVIPQMIDKTVPIGKDDSENVEVERFGEAFVRDYEIPYHADICESLSGLDKESAGRTSGNGFYYLVGDIARLHEATIAYARDFMISKGFTYCIPPFMIENEDLYLIGTSEHSMIGKFQGQIIDEKSLPIAMTSYSPCFRKEVGAHGIEERGLYRVHQFEKQEMIVLCKKEDAMTWYNKMWSYTVEFFRSMDLSVRTLECCSGDLADLKVKSCDVEAWSPRQQKYFEVGSCSTLGDAQARRLGIRMKTEKGNEYVATLNNTVIASPRSLIAILEQNYQKDGSVKIPKVLQPYMGGLEVIKPKDNK